MSLAHVTLPSRLVAATAEFLDNTLGYPRDRSPANSVVETVWFNIGNGQQLHVTFVDGFQVSPFEREFGRHVALFFPKSQFPILKQRLRHHGAELIEPLRATPYERFFFKEPINGYVFEVIEQT